MSRVRSSLDGVVNNFQIADTIDTKDGQRHFEKINIGTLSCSYSRQGLAEKAERAGLIISAHMG